MEIKMKVKKEDSNCIICNLCGEVMYRNDDGKFVCKKCGQAIKPKTNRPAGWGIC
jgi:predicted RNA-binding Zn-ribbon protein involved in translation (DUF1610 family)